MAGIAYLLDTNVISDLLKKNTNVYAHLQASLKQGDTLCICQPVYYEAMRGLLWAGAAANWLCSKTISCLCFGPSR